MDGFIDVPAAWPFATRPQLLARPRAPRSFDAGGEVVDVALLVDASQDEALAAHVAQAHPNPNPTPDPNPDPNPNPNPNPNPKVLALAAESPHLELVVNGG